MINEMLSRLVYTNVVDLPPAEAQYQLGVFGANYKVAVLITIFIQVFKMAAEPFFFQQSKHDDAKRTYARVMKFFVIIVCTMWLMIVTHLPLIQYLAYGSNASDYAEGLGIIPILAMGSVFLGIYYNLSIWYKLTDQTMMGAWITIVGAIITIALNIWWIPIFGYTGSAWATFVCYLVMMIASYVLGQRNYPVPYAWKKLVAYMVIIAVLYIIFLVITNFEIALPLQLLVGWIFIGGWLFFISKVERKELLSLFKKKG
jgi:O-antigen/teichoic acid export membrane protein